MEPRGGTVHTTRTASEAAAVGDAAAPEAAAPEAVRPVMGTLAWFMGPDLETSSPVCLREEEAATAAQEPR